MLYNQLIDSIETTHHSLRKRAISSINQQLVIRNWLIGFYIVEFEQNGEDRAKYGDKLTLNISSDLTKKGIKGMSNRSVKDFRQFYKAYPQILKPLSAKLENLSMRLSKK